ncbi:NO-inducible flavohemoprotein [Mucilaginibacter sp. OK098]|uniref:NO-inducible flavohemoprotein n=1 Tax=Mucilaginibacter sp. OK098 TaxID=1855297 RepID=UPI00091A8A6A|nr:NO-inducible flavohemoprotein [Mucilaginibacter sp. OK098]SHM94141.1 nitric oxide dioxygenase [Mucilaginibacter sp. OK098]
MITTEQKAVIKATVPVLRENGVLLTKHFYNRLLNGHPELKNVFNMGNQQNGRQQTALAMAVLAYAEHIENPEVLMPVINGIGNKHVSLNIQPNQYAIVGENLLASIGEVLGDAASEEILDAWAAAYGQLAALMSGHEQILYKKQIEANGWNGWKSFIVNRKVKESTEITSFYFYPEDGVDIPDFKPGQYLSVRLFLPELNLLQPRQYSISNSPNGKYYRISVKREAGNPAHADGMISNRLHDHINEGDKIELSAPSGNFILNDTTERNIVFISGGVGQTPLMSMLESLISSGSKVRKTWIHGCRDANVHAFREQLKAYEKTHTLLDSHYFYNEIENGIQEGIYKGWVDLERIGSLKDHHDADFYICGPAPFITMHYQDLVKRGVPKEQIYYEEFGPLNLQLN